MFGSLLAQKGWREAWGKAAWMGDNGECDLQYNGLWSTVMKMLMTVLVDRNFTVYDTVFLNHWSQMVYLFKDETSLVSLWAHTTFCWTLNQTFLGKKTNQRLFFEGLCFLNLDYPSEQSRRKVSGAIVLAPGQTNFPQPRASLVKVWPRILSKLWTLILLYHCNDYSPQYPSHWLH